MKKNYFLSFIMISGIFATSSALAAPRSQIVITSDSEFTAANGVINPGATGTATDPYYIQDWYIDVTGSNFPVCILVQGTTKYFVIRRNSCVNANVGMALYETSNGTVSSNKISNIRGTEAGFPAIGVYVFRSHGSNVSDNTISNLNGLLDIRSAYGIHLQGSFNGKILRNNISQIYGAKGTSGSPSFPGDYFKDGGYGFPGGDAEGILVEGYYRDQAENVLVQGNRISWIFGAYGGNGGSAAPSGNGGDAGDGGSAYGVFVRNMTKVTTLGNIVSNLYAANAGIGGLGGSGGGKGGKGGKGGNAEAISFDNSNALISNNNNFLTALKGGAGGRGGAGSGGAGGDGGNGGNGAGIHYHASSGFSHFGNSITNFLGGAGGTGGTPGGVNGAAGKTTAVLTD